jgi:hypothetical protein
LCPLIFSLMLSGFTPRHCQECRKVMAQNKPGRPCVHCKLHQSLCTCCLVQSDILRLICLHSSLLSPPRANPLYQPRFNWDKWNPNIPAARILVVLIQWLSCKVCERCYKSDFRCKVHDREFSHSWQNPCDNDDMTNRHLRQATEYKLGRNRKLKQWPIA